MDKENNYNYIGLRIGANNCTPIPPPIYTGPVLQTANDQRKKRARVLPPEFEQLTQTSEEKKPEAICPIPKPSESEHEFVLPAEIKKRAEREEKLRKKPSESDLAERSYFVSELLMSSIEKSENHHVISTGRFAEDENLIDPLITTFESMNSHRK